MNVHSLETDLQKWLQAHAGQYSPVVPVSENDTLIALDFTANNKNLDEAVVGDTERFAAYINQTLYAASARYGIGGYNEHRTIYSRSAVFDAAGANEPRRLHLGTDIWGVAGTPVFAPLDGRVHSLAFNNAYGDYGTLIILQHDAAGETFYTLYGHLNKASLQHLKENQLIQAGQQISSFGEPHENGHWPPHLHFQIINDLQGYVGDYPGVCRYSQREIYLQNCPDPDLILNINRFVK
jgi:murein DD-endopeptidase MepM/ murein hydrolase activator NlpD